MKVLVVSNNCFAKNNANGRILGCLFKNIPVEDVAQFYIIKGANDFDVCANYFHVSDSMAIRSVYDHRDIGQVITQPIGEERHIERMSKHRAKYGRSPWTMLIRNYIWLMFRWWTPKFEQWLLATDADVVVFQAGDAPFMYETAYRIAHFLDVPLVIFNTEFYYFEKENFINRKKHSLLFALYKSILDKKIRKVQNYASISIYNSDWMKDQYDQAFHKPSEVIYQSSDLESINKATLHDIPNIVYIGSLGYRRFEPLVEIAETLYAMNKTWRLSVYGMMQNEETKLLFERTPGIAYKGVIPYEKVLEVMADSDVLVMAENTDPEIAKFTAYGFSTKITDYLRSGIPIFAYGPSNNVGMSYLKTHRAAQVVNEKRLLEPGLRQILQDQAFRSEITHRGLELAERNHSASNNSDKFVRILAHAVSQE